MITFTCFPALAEDSSYSFLIGKDSEGSWYNLISVLLYFGPELAGKYVGVSPCANLKRVTTLILAGIRTIFIATFLLVAFEVQPAWLFTADWFKITNLALFSFTNGYVATLCAVKAPQTVEGELKGQVGAFVGVTILLGIILGATFALGMGQVILHTPKA